jgi:uncharacterized membrane protein YfcA
MSDVSWSGLAVLAVALVAAGGVTGFLAGLFGIGGGGVLVPVLYEMFTQLGIDPAVRMHLTLGTTLAVIAPTSATAFMRHRAKGVVDEALVWRLAPWVFAGVVIGVLVAKSAPSSALRVIWVISGTLLALLMIVGTNRWRLGDTIPRSYAVEGYVTAVGLISTLMSIGGAAYFTALMTLYGRPLISAIGTSSGFGPVIAIPGMIGFMWAGWGEPGRPPLSLGFVSVIGALVIIPMSVLTTRFGVRAAHGLSRRTLELTYALFLLTVAVRFLVSLIAG